MKLYRVTIMVLILALASSPALATICATTCASASVMSTMHMDEMSDMKNCHEHEMAGNSDQHQTNQNNSNSEHKHCGMGAGCHFSQLVTPLSAEKHLSVTATTVKFAGYVATQKSTDLSPPLKPPA